MAPSLVSTCFCLGSLTFSLRPNEVPSVRRQQKIVLNKYAILLCFSKQELIQHGYKKSEEPTQILRRDVTQTLVRIGTLV